MKKEDLIKELELEVRLLQLVEQKEYVLQRYEDEERQNLLDKVEQLKNKITD